MIKKCLFLLCFFSVLLSCNDPKATGSATLDSESPENQENLSGEKAEPVYSFTNTFQDLQGSNVGLVHVYLRSVNNPEQTFIVPPTKYQNTDLTYIEVSNVKVDGECVQVPESAFPVEIFACQTKSCAYVRPLGVHINWPGHYGLDGLRGFVEISLYPFSPCSEEFLRNIENVSNYQKVEDI